MVKYNNCTTVDDTKNYRIMFLINIAILVGMKNLIKLNVFLLRKDI